MAGNDAHRRMPPGLFERDVIGDRDFRSCKRFLPDRLSLLSRLAILNPGEAQLLSQIQGRTYANMASFLFGGLPLFQAIERLTALGMPEGYEFIASGDALTTPARSASTWSVLALTCHFELSAQAHCRRGADPDNGHSELYRDALQFHCEQETANAMVSEAEWRAEDPLLSRAERDRAVDDLVGLFVALDDLLRQQAQADTHYFLGSCRRIFGTPQVQAIGDGVLLAYRWQHISCGIESARFRSLLRSMITHAQSLRFRETLRAVTG